MRMLPSRIGTRSIDCRTPWAVQRAARPTTPCAPAARATSEPAIQYGQTMPAITAAATTASARRLIRKYTLLVQVRLQKIISAAGIASRRAAEKLIEEGRVSVNGE